MAIELIKHQVIPLGESVKQSKLVSLFKDAFIIPINNASRFLLICLLNKSLKNLSRKSDVMILRGEKDSIVVKMNRYRLCRKA